MEKELKLVITLEIPFILEGDDTFKASNGRFCTRSTTSESAKKEFQTQVLRELKICDVYGSTIGDIQYSTHFAHKRNWVVKRYFEYREASFRGHPEYDEGQDIFFDAEEAARKYAEESPKNSFENDLIYSYKIENTREIP